MNKRQQKVYDMLMSGPEDFNFGDPCDCIAGFAFEMAMKDPEFKGFVCDYETDGRRHGCWKEDELMSYLGLDIKEADNLFFKSIHSPTRGCGPAAARAYAEKFRQVCEEGRSITE